MKQRQKHYSFDLVLAMTLFCMFTVVALLLVGIGSRVYASCGEKLQTDYQLRTALSYLAGKTRYESVCLTETRPLENTEAIVLTERTESGDYETWIYFYDGALCEQYIPAGGPVDPAAGTALVRLEDFSFTLSEDGRTLDLTVRAAGRSRSLTLCVNRFAEVTP